jgi:hypothetical protein
VAVIGILALSRFNFRNGIDLERGQSTLVETTERRPSYSIEARRNPTRYLRLKPFAIFDNAIFGAGAEIRFFISSPQSGALYVISRLMNYPISTYSFPTRRPTAVRRKSEPDIRRISRRPAGIGCKFGASSTGKGGARTYGSSGRIAMLRNRRRSKARRILRTTAGTAIQNRERHYRVV